jgi:hypothetical protein
MKINFFEKILVTWINPHNLNLIHLMKIVPIIIGLALTSSDLFCNQLVMHHTDISRLFELQIKHVKNSFFLKTLLFFKTLVTRQSPRHPTLFTL